MRPILRVAFFASILLLAPSVRASSEVAYAHLSGTMGPGILVVGVEPVNLARVEFTPVADHHRVVVRLAFDPARVDAGVASMQTRMQVELSNATTGERFPTGVLRFDSPGSLTMDLPGDGPVRVELYLMVGVRVDYALDVIGEPDPTP